MQPAPTASPSPDASDPFGDAVQLVYVRSPSWLATRAEMELLERAGPAAPWRRAAGPWPVVLGRGGLGVGPCARLAALDSAATSISRPKWEEQCTELLGVLMASSKSALPSECAKDPAAHGQTAHNSVISQPMDLLAVRAKLTSGDYKSAEAFHADVAVAISNRYDRSALDAQLPTSLSAPHGKHEGDGRSPVGLFAITSAFGLAAIAPDGLDLEYLALRPTHQAVDDITHPLYNHIVDVRVTPQSWSSAEEMFTYKEE